MRTLKSVLFTFLLFISLLFVSGCSDNPVNYNSIKTVSVNTPKVSYWEGESDTIEFDIMLSQPLTSGSLSVTYDFLTNAVEGVNYILLTDSILKVKKGDNQDGFFHQIIFRTGEYRKSIKLISLDDNNFTETDHFIVYLQDVNDITKNPESSSEYAIDLKREGECIVFDSNGPTMTDADSNVYRTVRIGNLIWTQTNLKTTRYSNGDPIHHEFNSTTWWNMPTPAYCNYENNEARVEKYGRLYNWFAVNGPRKLVPNGWRIPTKSDWYNLVESAYKGSLPWSNAGTHLKEAGNENWKCNFLSCGVADNETGFTALPGGWRRGSFDKLRDLASFWSSTSSSSTEAYHYWLSLSASVNEDTDKKQAGFSVRAVKDITD